MTTVLSPAVALILPSELAGQVNAKTSNAQGNARLLDLCKQMSSLFQALTRRRFDERVETVYHTPLNIPFGDLLSAYDLLLRDDLKTVTTFLNGDGTAISPASYVLQPIAAFVKSKVRLNHYGVTYFWQGGGTVDPVDSIAITGTWGYGGAFVASGASLNVAAIPDAVAVTFNTAVQLEAGMFIRIDSEYMQVSSVTGSGPYTNTVDRGYNGSTAVSHLINAPIFKWRAHDLARRYVIRMVAWANEQDKAPLFGQVSVGDFTYPVDVSKLPADIQIAINGSGLAKTKKLRVV